MFELPRYVIKSGEVLVEEGDIRQDHYGRTLHVDPVYDTDVETLISQWFEEFYSVRFRNYPVSANYLHDPEGHRLQAERLHLATQTERRFVAEVVKTFGGALTRP